MATENLNLEAIELTDNMQTSLLQKMNGNMNKIDTAYGQLRDLLLAKTGKDNLKDAIEYVEQLVNAQDATITPDKVFNGYVGYNGLERIEGTALATPSVGNAASLLDGSKLYDSSGNLITGTMANKSGNSLTAVGSVSGSNYRLQIPTAGYYATNSYLVRDKNTVISDLGVNQIPTFSYSVTGSYSGYIGDYGAGIDSSGWLVIFAKSTTTSYEHISFNAKSIVGAKGNGWNVTNFDTGDPIAAVYACVISGVSGYSRFNITFDASDVDSSYDYVLVDITITAS